MLNLSKINDSSQDNSPVNKKAYSWLIQNWSICKRIAIGFNKGTKTMYSSFVSGNGHSAYTWDDIFSEAYLVCLKSLKTHNSKGNYGNFYSIFFRLFVNRLKELAQPFYNTYQLCNLPESELNDSPVPPTHKKNGVHIQRYFIDTFCFSQRVSKKNILEGLELMQPDKARKLYMLLKYSCKNKTVKHYRLSSARINQLVRELTDIMHNLTRHKISTLIKKNGIEKCKLILKDVKQKEYLVFAHFVYHYDYELLKYHFDLPDVDSAELILINIYNFLKGELNDENKQKISNG